MCFEKTDSGQDNKAKMFAGMRGIEHNNAMSDTIKLKLNPAAVNTSTKMNERGERTILRESRDRRHTSLYDSRMNAVSGRGNTTRLST